MSPYPLSTEHLHTGQKALSNPAQNQPAKHGMSRVGWVWGGGVLAGTGLLASFCPIAGWCGLMCTLQHISVLLCSEPEPTSNCANMSQGVKAVAQRELEQ